MPSKAYRIYLENGFVIAVSIKMSQGDVVSFVVRLIDARTANEHDLARYDTAHGWPHLDILTPTGNLKEKHWIAAKSFEDALTQGIKDFKLHYEHYQNDPPKTD